MLRILSPTWLAGLAALAVPLVLHLWNRRPTAVVRIGSLRGLAGPPGPRALGRRLEQIPLLLLRMSVLAAVAVGLAGPALRGGTTVAGSESVLLVDPVLLSDSLAVFSDHEVDSLRRAGRSVHLLAQGFPELEAAGTVPQHQAGIWALLRRLDDSLPPGSRVTVLTAMTADELGPQRPTLQSRYELRDLASVKSPPLADRPADTTRVELVVGQGFESDARLAAAAWSAAIQARDGVPPLVQERTSHSLDSAFDAGIIIWLAGQSVPSPVLERVAQGATLFEVVATAPAPAASQEIMPVSTGMVPAGLFHETLWLRSDVPAGAPVLADGSGQPLLSVAALGAGRHYRLATRLGGEWSTLGLGADLPEIALLTLRGLRSGADAAPVHPSQAAPRLDGSSPAADSGHWRTLTPWAILLAALLLAVERVIVHGRHRMETA